ncbi:alpha/beta hydrolase family protein [Inhella sp.]|uniref:alpha/beta hydrolase family protein n=1 Tax=Inhella sp. TaxID=1921806 RepID=UPI0035B45198
MSRLFRLLALAATTLLSPFAQAGLGVTTLAPQGPGDEELLVFYPSSSPEQALTRGALRIPAAPEGPFAAGNGRLVVVSHGSGGSPWVHADTIRALVDAGFTVAGVRHRGDRSGDVADRGPVSWERRPQEISRAIDRLAAQPQWAARLRLDRVGVYGMSAGGHTALSLAGGVWSPARFRDHCRTHLREDFQACVGLATQLTGSWLDGLRLALARRVLDARFSDTRPRAHHDPRIVAVVAGVPAAADFDPESLRQPRAALGLITVGQDLWLKGRFHAEAVLQACEPRCERLAHVPAGGHGLLLAPLPPGLDGLEGQMLNDPPGQDRRVLAQVHEQLRGFFERHLP